MRPISFLIAPDKFKGSLSAFEVARAMALGIRDVLPLAKIHQIPLADGGDGTAKILTLALGGRMHRARVHGPMGKEVMAAWGSVHSTAYLDLASASGLGLVPTDKRNPLKASSRGLGELLREATAHGARHFILGIGGSATVDGGAGAMRSLGIRFLNSSGNEIPEGGGGLFQLKSIDLSNCIWSGRKMQVTILADVRNPLLGPMGAARIFAPQKGATPSMVQILEEGLKRLNRCISQSGGKSVALLPSGGAAGGAAAGFLGVLGQVPGVTVDVTPGIDYVLQTLKVESWMKKADWVFTGEGQLDSQTEQGKTVHGVAGLARRLKKPSIAFVGALQLEPRDLRRMGLTSAFSIAQAPCNLQESIDNATPWIRQTVAQVVGILRIQH